MKQEVKEERVEETTVCVCTLQNLDHALQEKKIVFIYYLRERKQVLQCGFCLLEKRTYFSPSFAALILTRNLWGDYHSLKISCNGHKIIFI